MRTSFNPTLPSRQTPATREDSELVDVSLGAVRLLGKLTPRLAAANASLGRAVTYSGGLAPSSSSESPLLCDVLVLPDTMRARLRFAVHLRA